MTNFMEDFDKTDEIDLGINPAKINATEERLLVLLLNLMKFKEGISFIRMRELMSRFYANENIQSAQKKLRRDIKNLRDLGFHIRFYTIDYATGQQDVYRMFSTEIENKVKFSKKELKSISVAIMNQFHSFNTSEIYAICQKIFASEVSYFPKIHLDNNLKNQSTIFDEEILYKIIHAVRNKIPLKITYYKTTPTNLEHREIEPYQVIRRNFKDFYILAYDRLRKAKRKFLVQKITKLKELPGDFYSSIILQKSDLNYHALNFLVHPLETIKVECDKEFAWRFENYLYPHPFQKKDNRYQFQTTNRNALFIFMIKEKNVICKVNSRLLIDEFIVYKKNLVSFYRNLQ